VRIRPGRSKYPNERGVSKPTKETKTRIKEAAQLRVGGMSWDNVAAKYGYKNARSASWTLTQMHPDLWRLEYEAARELYLDEIEAEAALTQRQLLRHEDARIRQMAAHSLLNHCRSLRAQKHEVTVGGTELFRAQFGNANLGEGGDNDDGDG